MAKRVAAAPPEVDSESDDDEGESTKYRPKYDEEDKTMIAEWKGDVARLLELPWAKKMLRSLRKLDKGHAGELALLALCYPDRFNPGAGVHTTVEQRACAKHLLGLLLNIKAKALTNTLTMSADELAGFMQMDPTMKGVLADEEEIFYFQKNRQMGYLDDEKTTPKIVAEITAVDGSNWQQGKCAVCGEYMTLKEGYLNTASINRLNDWWTHRPGNCNVCCVGCQAQGAKQRLMKCPCCEKVFRA